jgi:hypothetical protein
MRIFDCSRLALVILVLLGVSCDTYQPPYYDGPEFVNFENRETSINEDGGPSNIRVNIGGPLNISPLAVQYIVKPNDNAVALYTIKNEGMLTIPGGQGYADIEITPVNNAIADGEKIVELTITALNNPIYRIGFPGPDALNSTTKVKIIDDDCSLDRSFITGTIVETSDDIVEEGGDPNATPPSYNTVIISEDPNDSKRIIISDFWGLSGSTLTLRLDACPQEAIIVAHDIVYDDPQNGPLQVTPTGSGTFDPSVNILTLELTLDVELGTFGKWKFTYKK